MADKQKIFWYGTSGDDFMESATRGNDVMHGGAGADYLAGDAYGNNVLIGGAGSDDLRGSGNTVMRFTSMRDSYRDASGNMVNVDSLSGFDPKNDRLDLTALGFTGLGDGTHGTLKMEAIEENWGVAHYLRSYETDQDGNSFVLQYYGDTKFTAASFQRLIDGSASADTVKGTSAGAETLMGHDGRDTLLGLAGDDRLVGGAGGDTLTGGEGADDFVFSALTDSVHLTASGAQTRDLITDFNAGEGDILDLSGLSFSALGDGHNGTLKVLVNAAGTQTTLKSLDADADGNRFEVLFSGNVAKDLNRDTVDFGNTTGTKIVNTLTRDNLDVVGTAGNDRLYGGAGDDQLVGFQGNDKIEAGAGNDVMAGGLGKDTLTGGDGLDTFIYYHVEESYRTAQGSYSDLITDFGADDRLFILDLGFDRLGNGRDGSLKMDYNAEQDRTYLRSFESDAEGRSFQLALSGEHHSASILFDGLVLDEVPIKIIGVNPSQPLDTTVG